MYHSRIKNNKINRLHERFLRFLCNAKQSSFHKLLERDNSVSIHKQKLGFLAVEMLRIIKGVAPTLVKEMFPSNKENRYKL